MCRSVAVRRGRRRATLVVCPTSLVSHWVEQLQAHLGPGVRLQLLVHHGQSRAVTGAELHILADCVLHKFSYYPVIVLVNQDTSFSSQEVRTTFNIHWIHIFHILIFSL